MERLIIDYDKSQLGQYKDYIGWLFRTEDGKYNVCDTEEDIMKSNMWFKNLPIRVINLELVTYLNPLKDGDKFVMECVNQELNNKILTHRGESTEGVGLLNFEHENGEKFKMGASSIIGNRIWRYLGDISREEKLAIMNSQDLCVDT